MFNLALDVPSIELAPKRKRSGCSQRLPISFLHQREPGEARLSRFRARRRLEADQMAGRFAVIAERADHGQTDWQVALTAPLPVEVLMKSAPAIIATQLAR